MQFGRFHAIPAPKPRREGKECNAFRQVLAQVQLVDAMGVDPFSSVEGLAKCVMPPIALNP